MFAKDALQVSNCILKDSDLCIEVLVNAPVNCAMHMKVNDDDCIRLLSDAVNSPNPLFNPHGIPRKVIVNHDAAELEINPFGCHFGTEQHSVVGCAEAPKQFIALITVLDIARNQQTRNTIPLQSTLKVG